MKTQSSTLCASVSPIISRIAAKFVSGLLFAAFAASLHAAPLQTLSGHVLPALKSLPAANHLAATNQLRLAIALPIRNPAGLSNLLGQIYNPASANYHHYLTPAQFTEQFGPAEQDYQALIAFAKANHLTIADTHPNRLLLDVTGSAIAVETALHVTLNTYQHPTENRRFYAPDREPSLNLNVPILHISGLDNFALPQPRLQVSPRLSGANVSPNSGSGTGGSYMGKDFRAAYVPDTALDGSGQAVGLLQFDGYSGSDITNYENLAGLPHVPLQNVLVDGASGNPTSGGQVEVCLDIEMAVSMATNLNKVIVYIAPNPSPFVDLLSRMANDNLAKQLSCSWYVPNGAAEPAADIIFQQMALQGQSFFSASGDSDAFTGLIPFPGDTPYITEVGGTTLTTTGPGGTYVSETVWNRNNGIGSGGGISTQYAIPGWQTNISMTFNKGSTTMRNVPDVALTAENVYVAVGGTYEIVGGTSCAAPLWAGFMALVNQQAAATGQPAVGFLNPLLDILGTSTNYYTEFHDTTQGNNTSSGSPSKFFATPGYDLCTGWGTPVGPRLINALANPEPLVITPPTGFAAIGGAGGPFSVTTQVYSLTNIGTNTLTWSLANTSLWLSASSASGSLAPHGPATPVTVSLNNAASNLVAGSYGASLWFTNQNDGVGQSRAFTLSIIAPPTITLQPTNQTVLQGASAIFAAQVSGGLPLAYQWQFNGTNLVDGTNILGTTTTNLNILSVASNHLGNYALVAANFAGSATSSNAALSITPSAPVIVSQPASQNVLLGKNVSLSAGVIGTTPFLYQWTFNGANVINATNATLTLANVQYGNAGTYAVLITNVLGSLASSNAVLGITPCDPMPGGIVAWWQAESNALDSINGNNAILMNNAFYTNGEVGTAFDFTGTYAYAVGNPSSPTNFDVGAGPGLTFEEWIKPATVSAEECLFDYERILGTSNGSDTGAGFAIHASGTSGILYANLVDTNNVPHEFTSPAGILAAGVWQHVALTYDKTSGVGTLYINGIPVTVANLGSFRPLTGFTNLVFGARTYLSSPSAPISKYYGQVDEISLYNRALSSNEIASVYQAGGGGKCFAAGPPVITAQPSDQAAPIAGSTSFTVVAIGTAPLFYQWSFNNTNIANATNTTLALTSLQLGQSGNYSVQISNLYGSTNSTAAALSVYGISPTITNQPVAQSVALGSTATLAVGATGTPPLAYQWSFNSNNIPGATNASLVISNAQFNQAGYYSASITNLFGATNTAVVALNVFGIAPTIITQPAGQLITVGSNATFGVSAAGTGPLAYQWSVNTNNIINATNATLLLTNVQLSQAGDYTVTITNLYGATNSLPANLAVIAPAACCPVPSGMVAWWQAQSNAIDSIGGNNITLMNGASFTNGEVGTAFNITAANTFLVGNPSSPANLNLGAGAGVTFEEWIRPSSITSEENLLEYERILGTSSGSDIGLGFAIHGSGSSGLLYANLTDINSNAHIISSPANILSPGVWQHIALTYDKASGVSALYINGVAVSVVNLGTFTAQTTFTNLAIGAHTYLSSPTFPSSKLFGQLDELGLYSRALSSNEIAAIYLAGANGKCPLPPFVLTQPTSQSVAINGNATFAVVAGGTPTLKYQWALNGTNIANATNATLTLTSIQPTNGGNYVVSIFNNYGLTNSTTATLIVQYGPIINTQPTNRTVALATPASFNVAAAGTAPLAYQWYFNTNTILSGATNPALAFASVQLTNAGYYFVRITNLYGLGTSSNALLTVQVLPPTIIQQPLSRTNLAGSTVFFSTTPAGSLPESYQWQKNGTTLVGATATNLILANIQDADAAAYALVVTNIAGSITSSPALLVVLDPPAITLQPTNQVVITGSNVFLVAAATGTAPLGYQWSFNGTNLFDSFRFHGSQSSTLVISNASLLNSGNYRLLVTNNYGWATSSVAVIDVGIPAHIITGPATQSAPLGCDITFTVIAGGTQPLARQWWKDGSLLTGQTNDSLLIPGFQSIDLGNYSVVLTNLFGCVTSSPAGLTVGYHPPVATADAVQRFARGGFKIDAAALLANDVDTNDDSLAIIAVSPNSTAGGLVGLTNNWVYYDPPTGWTNTDAFTYTLSDGHCETDTGTVLVQVMTDNPQPEQFAIALGTNGPSLSFTGLPGGTYQIQYTDDLLDPNWQTLTTVTADAFSTCQFTDLSGTNTTGRYYRAVQNLIIPLK